jgi:O-antigen ligase
VTAAALSGVVTIANPAQFSDLDGRIFGTLDNANAFAALLAVSIGLTLSQLANTRSMLVRIVCLALVAFFVYLVGRTGSRMGMLASFAAVVTVALCYQAGSKGKLVGKTMLVLLLGAAIVAGGAFVLTSSEFADRYAALQLSLETGDFRASGDMSLYGRARLYQKGFEIFLANPLLGVGLDVFRTAQLEFRTIGNNSHSNYLEILAGTGLVGGICYFAMYYHWWSKLLAARALLREPAIAAHVTAAFTVAVVVLVQDVAWVSYYEKLTLLVLAGLIAEVNLLSGARRQVEQAPFRRYL